MIYGTRTLWVTLGLLALAIALLAFIGDKFYDWKYGNDKEWESQPLNEEREVIEVWPDAKM